MATKIGDLFFEVTAVTDGARKDILALGRDAETSAGLIAGAMGIAFTAVAVAAATTAAVVVKDLVEVGAAFNIAGQKATGLFTALTGSLDNAIGLMKEFRQVALDQPIFSTDALQNVTRTLLAYGVAKDDVIEMSIALNSTATALGVGSQGAERLALALGQIASRGWFSAEEARQLANYGVNAYKLIADAMGLTVAKVRELGQAHKLLSEDVLPILTAQLQSTFGPVAQNLISTYGVQVQGLKNIFQAVGSALVQPFIGSTSGGALTDFLSRVREELGSVVKVADDGTYRLIGALEPLNDVTQALADGFAEIGDSIVNMIAGLESGDGIQRFSDFATNVIPAAVDGIRSFVSGTIDFVQDLWGAIQPVIPPFEAFIAILADFAVQALPIIADGVVNFAAAAAPLAADLLKVADVLLVIASPAVLEILQGIADAFGNLADQGAVLVPVIEALAVAWAALKVATAATAVNVGVGGIATLGISSQAVAFATLAGTIALAVEALGAYNAVSAGIDSLRGGDKGEKFLTADKLPFYEKPFQDLARKSYEAFGLQGPGSVETLKQWQEYADLVSMNIDRAKEFAASQNVVGMSVAQFRAQAEAAGFTYTSLAAAVSEFSRLQNAQISNWMQEAAGARDANDSVNAWEARVRSLSAATEESNNVVEDQIDILKELKTAAAAAWEDVSKLMQPPAGDTIEDFFRGLPKIGEDLTKALGEDAGVFKDLDVSGALSKARDQALKVIQTLAKDYGLSFDQIKALFDERGLSGVLEELGTITKETTETVDPLIAKYGSLGATTEQLRAAVSRLNQERQDAISRQIDSVQNSLEAAKDAALEARQAIKDFFSGGYLDSPQQLVDKLIGSVGGIGSAIEDALRTGGVRGEAAIRSTLGDVQGQLAQIVNAGLEAGLSGQQITDLLQPVFTAINEETADARNRINGKDFNFGFVPTAGSTIADMLNQVLDPGAIQQLMNNVLGADNTVSGLEKQLENLQAQLHADVEFSPQQVQGALDDISAENKRIVTTPVVTPEAAQLISQAIQAVLDDPSGKLEAVVDQAVITQQILDAAQEAQDSISLVFKSGLSFNSAELDSVARQVGAEFYAAFQGQLQELRDQQAQQLGFENYPQMVAALGPSVAAAVVGTPTTTQTVQIDAPITVQGTPDPIRTATETVSAFSAAAGSGGSVNQLLQRYGTTLIPGYKGPQ